jgi:cellulose biosynthesis protein BcsQ
MKIILTLQGKGGVGKTTTTCQLALAAVRAGKSVLVVDADSQMNLTHMLLSPTLPSSYKGDIFEYINENKFTSLEQSVNFLREGVTAGLTQKLVDVGETGRLHLMVGSMNTSELDEHIGIVPYVYTSFPVLQHVPAMPMYAIRKAAEQIGGVDYVFIDSNPNLGALNSFLWWEADYFFVPCFPDAFSAAAIQFVGKKIEAWKETIRPHLSAYQGKDDKYGPTIHPVILKSEPARCLGLTMTHLREPGDSEYYWCGYGKCAAKTALDPLSGEEFVDSSLDKAGLFERIVCLIGGGDRVDRHKTEREEKEEDKEGIEEPLCKKARKE